MREGYCICHVCVYVCPSVRLSVPPLAALAYVCIMCNQRYSRFSKRPSVRELWREKANMQISWGSPRAIFVQFQDQRNTAASEGQLVGNRSETSEIQVRAWFFLKCAAHAFYFAPVAICACANISAHVCIFKWLRLGLDDEGLHVAEFVPSQPRSVVGMTASSWCRRLKGSKLNAPYV